MILENKFLVGAAGTEPGRVVILGKLPPILTREEAINLAAWLAAVTDPRALLPESEFHRTFRSAFES